MKWPVLWTDDSDDESEKQKDLAKSSGNLRNTMFGGISRKADPAPVKDKMIEAKQNAKVSSTTNFNESKPVFETAHT